MAFPINTLEYARRLREAGFSAQQAEGQAEALAAAMTDTLATKQDLRELELRMDAKLEARFSHVEIRFAQVDARFEHLDTRLVEMEKRMEIRLGERESRVALRLGELENRIEVRMDGRFADLERRLTMRLGAISIAGFGVISALVTLLE